MGKVTGSRQVIQWYAVRTKPTANRNRSTSVLGGRYKIYQDRAGRRRNRLIKGTGKREFVVETILRKHGFEVFLPTKKVWRFYDWKRRLKHQVDVPEAPGWVFVGWPEGESRWKDLFGIDLVHEVAGLEGFPVRIDNAVMTDLFERWGDITVPDSQRFMRTHYEFKIGDLVRIAAGPLDGLECKVVDLCGPKARIMAELLGGMQRIEIDTMVLELV